MLPERPAKVEEAKYGFLVRYDWDQPDEIVGFESIDFSLFVPHIGESGILPRVDILFDIENGGPKGLTLKELLSWAYEQYILKPRAIASVLHA